MKILRVGFVILVLVAVAAVAGVAGGQWVLRHAVVHVPLHDQPLAVRMPADMPVTVEVLAAGAPGAANRDGVPVRLREQLQLRVDMDAEVPLALTVRYVGEIPVRAEIPVDTAIDTRVMGVNMTLPIKGTIPLDFMLPLDLTIPIEQDVRLDFSAPMSAHIDQDVTIPLRAGLDARIRFGEAPIDLMLQESELVLPLGSIGYSLRQ